MRYLLTSLLVLSAFVINAQWVRGTIIFPSGEEKTGYIRNIKNEKSPVIEYKQREKDLPVEFSGDIISEVHLRLKEGTLVTKYLYTSELGIGGDYNLSKDRTWLRVTYRGEFDVMNYLSDSFIDHDYFINWPGEDKAVMIYIPEKIRAVDNHKASLQQKSIKAIFEHRCNSMCDSVEKGMFIADDIKDILRFYVENCKEIAETVKN